MIVLLVEDEVSLREVYTEVLSDSGFVVKGTGDGQEAMSMINAGDWDLLLLDIMLPRMDGIQVLKTINSDPSLKTKPVVIISNLQDNDIINTCKDLGARDFVVKSAINPSDLVNVVVRYLPDEPQ